MDLQIIRSNENTIHEYFEFIKPNIGKDSIFRLLSPLLQIFFLNTQIENIN